MNRRLPLSTTLAVAIVAGALAAPTAALAADPIIAAAGDIACDPNSDYFNNGSGDATHCQEQATSDLLTSGRYTQVLPLGDTQYEDGALAKFQTSYDPSWGRVRSISRPAVGNHEYSSGGAGYFDYFNGVGNLTGPAGDRSKGYYSFDVSLPSGSRWHIVAINSECSSSNAGNVGQAGACDVGSAQEQWLKADLAANSACTLAYWHHPLFSSGGIGNNASMQPIWRDLYAAGADVVLNGHDHNYERFSPQSPQGTADAAYGIREFVVGTGGKSQLAMGTTKPNSEVRQNSTFGVLELTLHDNGYDWRFAPEAGRSYTDSGSAACHDAPAAAAPTASTTDAGSIGPDSARVLGTVNPNDQATSYHFDYGTTDSYGLSTTDQPVTPTDNADHQVWAALTGLAPSTTYHYKVVATTGSGGPTYGQDRTFTTAAQASTAYSGDVRATPQLQSYWRLGESTGTVAADAVGSRAGTYRGGFSLGLPGVLFGDVDTAALFDGSSGEVAATGPSLSGSGSIEGWFYWQRGGVLLRDNTSAASGGWILAWDNGGTLFYRVAGKSYNTGRSASTYKNAWHHFVLTKSSGSVALYIDGSLVHSGRSAPNTAAVMPWHLMRNGTYSTYAGGRADELAIYGGALSASTVARHYSLGRSG
jgi:acid phosphatase type 7